MRLNFGKEEWLHILMAMRVAQKVLTDGGEHYTAAYDHSVGYRIIGELMRLVKVAPDAPQVGPALDAAMVLDALPDLAPPPRPLKPRRLNAAGFPVEDDDELAPPPPRRSGPVIGPPVRGRVPPDAPFNGLAMGTPAAAPPEPTPATEPQAPKPAPAPDTGRLAAMEAAVNQALSGLTQAMADIDKLTEAHNQLAASAHERFLAVDEYVYAIDDKLAAIKKRKP